MPNKFEQLFVAIGRNQPNIVSQLLQDVAVRDRINEIYQKGFFGHDQYHNYTPLTYACSRYTIDMLIIPCLVHNGARLNQADGFSRIPLQSVASVMPDHYTLHLLQILIVLGVDLNQPFPKSHEVLLIEILKRITDNATDRENISRKFLITEMLSAPSPADANSRSRYSSTSALCLAVKKGSVCCAEELIKHGAYINYPDMQGSTPLMCAVSQPQSAASLVDLLLNYNAAVGLRNQDGKTALSIAEDNNLPIIVDKLKKAIAKQTKHTEVKETSEEKELVWEQKFSTTVDALKNNLRFIQDNLDSLTNMKILGPLFLETSCLISALNSLTDDQSPFRELAKDGHQSMLKLASFFRDEQAKRILTYFEQADAAPLTKLSLCN